MKLFIDTADVGEIREAHSWGVLDGVTTNPSLVAKAGAAFISPFVGRLDDIGHDGMELIGQILEMLDHYTYPAEVLVASVRNPLHVIKGAQMGAHIATCPFAVLQQLAKHPLTDVGLERFLADWKKTKR